ncbi:Uncharacterised protein [Neisseria meningitidis]|nr:cytosine-specific methyltransferase NlaX [Neisseria meningitidis 98008]CWO24566.1 Uncharacterised protein [Neisseria meningitidis]CWS27743.1 Uncharacterised protein [Neisseria meningitidis]
MTQCVLSTSLNPAGLSLKTLRVCSIATMAKTFKQSSSPLPNAGMWDTGACLMQHISESPRHAVEFSWSLDWESTPPMSLWLTPAQLESYLARLTRAGCKSRMVLCLEGFPMEPLTAQAQIFSLRPTDGVRWLSGKERLTMMGFSSEWMRPTLRRLKLRETPSVRRSHAGLPKN